MTWLEAEKLREVAEAVMNAAKEAEAKGSRAYAHIDVDSLTRTMVITTGNSAFDASGEIRRGRLGDWALIWNRTLLWVATGEDFMPPEIREWLLENTRAEEVWPRAEEFECVGQGGEGDCEGEHEHYWDIYPW